MCKTALTFVFSTLVVAKRSTAHQMARDSKLARFGVYERASGAAGEVPHHTSGF